MSTLTRDPRAEAGDDELRQARRLLCVFPRYAQSFGTFDHAFPLLGVSAFMPPQGILVVAAYLPADWEVRLVDENVRPVTEADLQWADAVFLTGMHVQRARIEELTRRVHAAGKLAVLGGPSVSAMPELYPDADLLHVGELGDATDAIIERLRASVGRPPQQEVYRTVERLPLDEFPLPAYRLLELDKYLLGSIQFSSGCPFRCEFCDIPGLYGRRPRTKTVEQVTAELDAMLEAGGLNTVYFVDDNFIANPNLAEKLLSGLVAWQERNGFPLVFACEATLNIAQRSEVLRRMRDARFTQVFLGVETPDVESLRTIGKTQNLRTPILESIAVLNEHGLEAVAGIIMGLDGDDVDTGRRVLEFIEASRIPMLTINLLHALPGTPLWDRLRQEGRLLADPGDRESNVEFLRAYDDVVETWRDTVAAAFTPERLYERFRHQVAATYPNRRQVPATTPGADQVVRGLRILARVLWRLGVRGSYRREFWAMALPLLRTGRLDRVIHIATVTHHLVTFAGQVADGTAEKCFYNPHNAVAVSR